MNINTETMEKVMKAALIIEQQQEIINENIGEIASAFEVNKSIAKKIITAYAKDKLEKTQEKIESDRVSLSNAEILIEAVENMSIDTSDIEQLED